MCIVLQAVHLSMVEALQPQRMACMRVADQPHLETSPRAQLRFQCPVGHERHHRNSDLADG
jgi:hypothetical protein